MRIAALDTTTNTNNALPWGSNANLLVETIAVTDSTVFAGGQFATVGGLPRRHLAALDATMDINNVNAWAPNATHPVRSLTVSGPLLIVGGNFADIAGQRRPHFAVFDLVTTPPDPPMASTLWVH
jgi:hypothetical protein